MRKDIQDALESVGEVAVFAWSLVELLLTRILPLAGFLTGHLVLQFGHLLASVVVSTAAGRRELEPHAEYSYDVQAELELIEDQDNVQAEELIEEDNVLVVKGADGDHQNDLESLEGRDKLEERQVISLRHDEDADVQAAAMPAAAEHVVHLAESVPSDAAANEVQLVRGSDMADLGANVADVVGEEERQVSANGEGSGDRMDLEPSDHVQTSEEATSPSTEGEMRQSRRRMRVLPPSLSQIKRTLMQRSRRASASTPSPSPIKKKKQNISPGSRKLVSSAIKSSPSYDNFMGKFRKHFLIDRA